MSPLVMRKSNFYKEVVVSVRKGRRDYGRWDSYLWRLDSLQAEFHKIAKSQNGDLEKHSRGVEKSNLR